MAFETFPGAGPYPPEDLTADLNTNFGKTIEVALGTLADGEFLIYDGSASIWINATAAEAGVASTISGLSDVTIATVADGEFLRYDGSSSSWINVTAAEAGIPVDLEDLGNVSVATPADGEVLTYDASSSSWINAAGSSTIAGLTDTSIATPADGEILVYDGSSSSWINVVNASGASTIDGLTDTSIATLADGEVLTYDGSSTSWINAVPRASQELIGVYDLSVTTLATGSELDLDVSSYSALVIHLSSGTKAVSANVQLLFSANGGSTFRNGASDYYRAGFSSISDFNGLVSSIPVSNTGTTRMMGHVTVEGLNLAGVKAGGKSLFSSTANNAAEITYYSETAEAVDTVRFVTSDGVAMTGGSLAVFGVT